MFANLLKFILGFLLALTILIGGGVAAALYFMNRTSAPPTKPIFVNDKSSVKGQNPKSPVVGETKPTSLPQPEAEASPDPTPTPSATPKPLPAGAYRARVTWPQGLILRAEAKQDAERLGGIGFNAKIFVLEESEDKVWQKIRLEESDQEGWVKAGNTKKVDEQEDSQQPEQAPQ